MMNIRIPFNGSLLFLFVLMMVVAVGCEDDDAGDEAVEVHVDMNGTDLDEETTPAERPVATPDVTPNEEAPAPATAGDMPKSGSSVSDGETLYLSWIMDKPVENPSTGVPVSRLRLSVNGNAFVVMQKTNGKHEEIPKGEFGKYKIPASAIGAVKSWWAGAGDVVYAIRAGNTIRVMRAEVDEKSGQGEFKEIVTQPIS